MKDEMATKYTVKWSIPLNETMWKTKKEHFDSENEASERINSLIQEHGEGDFKVFLIKEEVLSCITNEGR